MDTRHDILNVGDTIVLDIAKLFSKAYTPNDCVKHIIEIIVNNMDEYPEMEDMFVNSGNLKLKLEMVYCNKCLDKLIDDDNEFVRREIARKGYGLAKLINDRDPFVRAEVAHQGYCLEKLINDDNPRVRCEVATQGYHLNTLLGDEDRDVRDIASEMLEVRERQYKNKMLGLTD